MGISTFSVLLLSWISITRALETVMVTNMDGRYPHSTKQIEATTVSELFDAITHQFSLSEGFGFDIATDIRLFKTSGNGELIRQPRDRYHDQALDHPSIGIMNGSELVFTTQSNIAIIDVYNAHKPHSPEIRITLTHDDLQQYNTGDLEQEILSHPNGIDKGWAFGRRMSLFNVTIVDYSVNMTSLRSPTDYSSTLSQHGFSTDKLNKVKYHPSATRPIPMIHFNGAHVQVRPDNNDLWRVYYGEMDFIGTVIASVRKWMTHNYQQFNVDEETAAKAPVVFRFIPLWMGQGPIEITHPLIRLNLTEPITDFTLGAFERVQRAVYQQYRMAQVFDAVMPPMANRTKQCTDRAIATVTVWSRNSRTGESSVSRDVHQWDQLPIKVHFPSSYRTKVSRLIRGNQAQKEDMKLPEDVLRMALEFVPQTEIPYISIDGSVSLYQLYNINTDVMPVNIWTTTPLRDTHNAIVLVFASLPNSPMHLRFYNSRI